MHVETSQLRGALNVKEFFPQGVISRDGDILHARS
jgi:hypothetical protein